MKLGEVITEAVSGFACGQRADDGVIQVRMNNVTRRGELDWSSVLRVPSEMTDLESFALRSGDVLFNNTNSTEMVGKTACFKTYDEPVVFSNHFTRLRADTTKLNPDYLALWLHKNFIDGLFAKICDRWIGQAAVQRNKLLGLEISLPPLTEQRHVAVQLREQMAEVERARAAVQAQLDAVQTLVQSLLRESLKTTDRHTWRIPECLAEITDGIGERWNEFRVLGATRAGLAPAKEGIGKNPGRYKPVTPGTVFCNPMRILLGSIAMVSEDDTPGITSPDYVVMRGIEGHLHSTWFYYWFRSPAGAAFIQSLTRGAVRERLLFNRLAKAEIETPSWETQLRVVEQLREIKALRQSLEIRLAEIELLPAALLRAAFSRRR